MSCSRLNGNLEKCLLYAIETFGWYGTRARLDETTDRTCVPRARTKSSLRFECTFATPCYAKRIGRTGIGLATERLGRLDPFTGDTTLKLGDGLSQSSVSCASCCCSPISSSSSVSHRIRLTGLIQPSLASPCFEDAVMILPSWSWFASSSEQKTLLVVSMAKENDSSLSMAINNDCSRPSGWWVCTLRGFFWDNFSLKKEPFILFRRSSVGQLLLSDGSPKLLALSARTRDFLLQRPKWRKGCELGTPEDGQPTSKRCQYACLPL